MKILTYFMIEGNSLSTVGLLTSLVIIEQNKD